MGISVGRYGARKDLTGWISLGRASYRAVHLRYDDAQRVFCTFLLFSLFETTFTQTQGDSRTLGRNPHLLLPCSDLFVANLLVLSNYTSSLYRTHETP
jgi:hypothetical protein